MKSLASGQKEAVSLTDAAESRSLPIPPSDCRSFAASQFTRHEDLDPMPMETQIRGCGLDSNLVALGSNCHPLSNNQQKLSASFSFFWFSDFWWSSKRTKHQRIDALLFGRGFAILMSQKADPYNHWLDVLPEESQ